MSQCSVSLFTGLFFKSVILTSCFPLKTKHDKNREVLLSVFLCIIVLWLNNMCWVYLRSVSPPNASGILVTRMMDKISLHPWLYFTCPSKLLLITLWLCQWKKKNTERKIELHESTVSPASLLIEWQLCIFIALLAHLYQLVSHHDLNLLAQIIWMALSLFQVMEELTTYTMDETLMHGMEISNPYTVFMVAKPYEVSWL